MKELHNAFKQAGEFRRDEDINEIIKKVDFDHNGEINYSEFVSGTLDRSLLNKDNLWKVFKYLDTENIDLLTYECLMRTFQRKGDFNLESFNKMMVEVGVEIPSPKERSSSMRELTRDVQRPGIPFPRLCEIMGVEIPQNLDTSTFAQESNNARNRYSGNAASSTRSNSNL
jgi:Ca2+-binding EF-hand superfamily protein